jgi:hypothetical protein
MGTRTGIVSCAVDNRCPQNDPNMEYQRAKLTKPAKAIPTNHKCACGRIAGLDGECAECHRKRLAFQRRTTSHSEPSTAPPIVREVLHLPGRSLDSATRAFMEPRFGHDFGQVRVHTDAKAAESARAVNALAYTVRRDIFFANSQYDLGPTAGDGILAHELAHVVQQRGEPIAAGETLKMGAPEPCERQADAAARAIRGGLRPARVDLRAGTSVMLLTPEQFRTQLGATQDQKTAIDALFTNTAFLELWNYARDCPATPQRDLGPLTLKVTPGLKIGGVERFGGYSSFGRRLEINPTKPEHTSNPAELVDTIAHELIHAVDEIQADCVKAGAKASPLAGAATAHPPLRSDVAGTAEEAKLMRELGPGASNPCEEFIDINKAAQHMVIQIIKSNIKVAKVGRPTITFVNEILRTNPQAMSEYVKCRDAACANPVAADRSKAVASCSANILARYMPPVPAVSRPVPERPKFGPLYQPRRDFREKIIQSAEEL